jgi:Icc-related predicted phosphoesterase
MRIKLVSDLHLEFSDIYIPNDKDYDVLILAGDILVIEKLELPGSEYGKRFREFLQRVSGDFTHVIYIAGNHEFYGGGRFHQGITDIRNYCQKNFTNVYFLEMETKIIDDVVFVGGTLWTDMNKGDPLTLHGVRDMMNDYRAIRNDQKGFVPLKPLDTVERHRKTLEYFRIVLDQNKDRRCVVVGHHTPSWQSCHEKYRGDFIMNGAYHSSLEDFILDRPQIKLWVHGHTHDAFDYMIGDTRIVCNPRGYESYSGKEDTGWDPNIVLEV